MKDSDPEVRSMSCSPGGTRFSQNGEVCTDDALVCPSRSHLEIGRVSHPTFVSGSSLCAVQVLPEELHHTEFEAG